MKKICVVLGMHRSGTSAVTRGIVALGAHPGENLMPANSFNELGYWEDNDIFSLNNEILNYLYVNWNDVDTIQTHRMDTLLSLYKDQFFDRAVQILNNRFNYSEVIVIKDPKINILLPFWKEVFKQITQEVRYVVLLRNPEEVAKSLNNRDSLPLSKGKKLWLYYNYRTLHDLDREFLTVSYSRFLEHSEAEISRIGNFLGLEANEQSIEEFRNKFLQKSLKHHHSEQEKVSAVGKVYQEMMAWSTRGAIHPDESHKFLQNNFHMIAEYLKDLSEDFYAPGFILIDEGRGYRTDLYEKSGLKYGKNSISLNLEKYSCVENVRIDSGNNPCILVFQNVLFESEEGISGYKVLGGNYIHAHNNIYFFVSKDPQIVIKPDNSDIIRANIQFELLPMDTSSLLFLTGERYKLRYQELRNSIEEKSFIIQQLNQQIDEVQKLDEKLAEFFQPIENFINKSEKSINDLDNKINSLVKTIREKEDALIEEINVKENLTKHLIEENGRKILETEKKLKETIESNQSIEDYLRKTYYFIYLLLAPVRLVKFIFALIVSPKASLKYLREKWLIRQWGIFDEKYYLLNNKDLKLKYVDFLKHFILHGWKEERSPSQYFDVKYYLAQNPDVRECGMNPLYHFIRFGLREGRRPAAEPDYFGLLKAKYKPKSKWNPIYLALKAWEVKQIHTSGKFSKAWYWSVYNDVHENVRKSYWWKLIDSRNKILSKIARTFTHPIWHYVIHGVYEGRNPAPFFDTVYYLRNNPDVARAKMNPFYHYCRFGCVENRPTQELKDVEVAVSSLLFNAMEKQGISYYQMSKGNEEASQPLVSVIVPNYNHAAYLRQRLDSIYQQTYQNFEVILMDDCSQDNSLDILNEYYEKFPEKTKLIVNQKNSGGVFYQWEKGLSLAQGDLVWIAESDDWCTENFLEELTKNFIDEAVMLAYCQTVFMNGNGDQSIWTIQEFLQDIDPNFWKQPFIIPAHYLVNYAWSIKNIIPNVSSAVFRNPVKMDLLNDPLWKSMRICGDWVFYIHLVRGGLVAYTTHATNYYRMHNSNTSVGTYKKDVYYKEHEMVSKYIRQNYKVSADAFLRQAENLKKHWLETRGAYSEKEFNKLFNVEEIISTDLPRKPNILMAGYSFSAGGGETFPIYLANILKENGYGVTFLCCDQEKREIGIQNLLRKDIPIVNNVPNLYKIMVDFGIEIIHSHHAWVDHTIIDLLPKELAYSHVVTLHGMYEAIPKKDLKYLLPRLLTRTKKQVFTASKNLDPFKEAGLYEQGEFVEIGNAYVKSEVNPVCLREFGIPSDAFVICHVSRAIPEKGWEEAIDSVTEARKLSGRDIHLLLIGEGPEYERLKDHSPSYVHFLGFRGNIQDFYGVADLGFLPSRFKGESFPLVVIACLQSGKPVLASDVGEISSMLQSDEGMAGTVFPLKNGQIPVLEVAQIISKFATDSSYYHSKLKVVESAADKFSVEKLFAKYDLVYQEVQSVK